MRVVVAAGGEARAAVLRRTAVPAATAATVLRKVRRVGLGILESCDGGWEDAGNRLLKLGRNEGSTCAVGV